MKTSTMLISLALALAATAAVAQNYNYTNLNMRATQTNSTSALFSNTNLLSMVFYGQAGFEYRGAGAGNGSNNLTFRFVRSNDRTNWETRPQWTWVIPAQGTNSILEVTQFDAGPFLYVKLFDDTNANATDQTNAQLFGITKGLRRDGR